MPIALNTEQKQIRKLLINVAKGAEKDTRFPYLITYKELWQRIYDTRWGRGCASKLVQVIFPVSAYEFEKGRTLLNELVVNQKTREPSEPWGNIKKGLGEIYSVFPSYTSHAQAQRACWEYWGNRSVQDTTTAQQTNARKAQAEEGETEDRTIIFRRRNAQIIQDRKKIDNYTCQACNLKLNTRNVYIIDCHHINPLGANTNSIITKINDLVCLCPTCHRISHTKKPKPLSVDQIRRVRKSNGLA